MKKILLFTVVLTAVMALTSCGGKKDEPTDGDIEDITMSGNSIGAQFASFVVEGDSTKSFGKEISADGAINVKNMAADPAKADGFEGKVAGTVVSVCQNKGCWMKLDTGNGQTMMVTFKDYGFFVPKDIAGQMVVIEGTASLKTVTVEEQQHYAEDAGKSREEIEAIKDPKVELSFVADGVLLMQ